MKYYSKDTVDKFLDIYGEFFIETTSGESFSVRKTANGYLWKDLTPPAIESKIISFTTIFLKKASNGLSLKEDGSIDAKYFDGIEKGGNFAFFDDEASLMLSKGKIEKFYFTKEYDNQTIRIQMFDLSGKKVDTFTLLSSSFLIKTRRRDYAFTFEKTPFFEGREVTALYSMFNTKAPLSLGDILATDKTTTDVSSHLFVLNRPFIVESFDKEKRQTILTHVYEPALGISELHQ